MKNSSPVRWRRTLALAVAAVAFFAASPRAQAHDFWVNASEPKDGIVAAEIGYGHDFPRAEAIPADRTQLFEPLRLVTPQGVQKLQQEGPNYAYRGKCSQKTGGFLVLGDYRPTFWSNGEGGWTQTNRKQRPHATYCEEVTMYAKTVVDLGGAGDDFVTKPAGQRLEIVPRVNPSQVKAGQPFPVQILLDGKPVKTAELVATYAGFSKKEYKAFQGRTDLQGNIDIIPLRPGYWFAEVTITREHKDKSLADEELFIATLSFRIDS